MVSTSLVTLASSARCFSIAYMYIGLVTNTTLVMSYIPYRLKYRYAKQIGGKGVPTCGEGVKGIPT